MLGHARLPLAALALACATAALPATAAAQTPADEQARTHFQSGRLYFDRGEYDAALREFEAAYELSHRWQLLYNIYLTLERLGRPGDAADQLEAYLGQADDLDDETRANYATRVENLRARAAAEEAARTEPATPVAPPPPPAEGIGTLGIVGIAGLAAGGASLVAFAITGGLAASEDGALADRCGANAGRTCTEADVSTLRALTTTADVTLAVGLVLAAAGGTLLAIDLATTESAPPVAVAPMLGPTLAGIRIGGAL